MASRSKSEANGFRFLGPKAFVVLLLVAGLFAALSGPVGASNPVDAAIGDAQPAATRAVVSDEASSNAQPGGSEAPDPFAIAEIRIAVEDASEFRGLPAWEWHEFRSGVQWSVRSDLFDGRGRGFILVGVHDDKTSRAVAAVPFPAGEFTSVLPLPDRHIDPERRAALLQLNERLPALALGRNGEQLFVAECGVGIGPEPTVDDESGPAVRTGLPPEIGSHPCEDVAPETIRTLLVGDTVSSAGWPGVDVTFHPPVEHVLAFRIFIDYLPPTGDDD